VIRTLPEVRERWLCIASKTLCRAIHPTTLWSKSWCPLSATGHKRAFAEVCVMSISPSKANIDKRDYDARFVPIRHKQCSKK
jgi:hypothetical protein